MGVGEKSMIYISYRVYTVKSDLKITNPEDDSDVYRVSHEGGLCIIKVGTEAFHEIFDLNDIRGIVN
jgi:hypothetical protein